MLVPSHFSGPLANRGGEEVQHLVLAKNTFYKRTSGNQNIDLSTAKHRYLPA